MSKINEFIEALRQGKGYGWIANHGWELSKDELCNIIKECLYSIDDVADNLEDLYGEE